MLVARSWSVTLVLTSLACSTPSRVDEARDNPQMDSDSLVDRPIVLPEASTTEIAPTEVAPAEQEIDEGHQRDDTPPPPPLTREQRREIASALAQGRRAVRDHEYARAIELYERGLAIDRQQPKLLCEAGWAAVLAEDPRAVELLSAGVDVSPIGPGRAACLYNLGRAYERDGQPARAANAYARSLDLRASNRETQRRYRALTGKHYQPRECPPAGRFNNVEAFCDALWDRYALDHHDPEDPPERPGPDDEEMRCARVHEQFKVEGPALGELVLVVEPYPDYRPYWSNYLLLQRDGMLEPLGQIGTNYGRACSVGSVEIVRAQWQSEGAIRLIVDLHAESEYSGYETTPREDCEIEAEERGKPTTHCESLSNEYPIDILDERYRLICAEIDGQLRCSAPPEFPVQSTATAARFNPLPTGDALATALVCPHEHAP